MVGTDTDEGIMVRSVADLFILKEKAEKEEGSEIKISMSYIEVYNETILDLMVDKSESIPLEIYDVSGGKNQIINGVTEIYVKSSNQVFDLLTKGNKNRSEESTEKNDFSSRSHAILTINVETILKNQNGRRVAGKFILVDLAGSEKANYGKNQNQRILEGSNINKSLLSLSNCINAMVDKKVFVPWRDSKLTRILQSSIGGNSRLVLIANISPSVMAYEETLYTLKWADRAKNIKREVTQNYLPDVKHVEKYEEILSKLKEDIEETKTKLKNSGTGFFNSQSKEKI